jgi:hypothetical protein
VKDNFWHMNSDFLSSPPRKVVQSILFADKKNYKKAESELSDEVTLLEDALTLYVTSLQGGYRNAPKWQDNISVKAAVAMANSALNYLFLARHAILLGYFPEARNLLRGCHERMTRCYLFFADKDEAQKFLSGKKLSEKSEQLYVDKKLATILRSDESYKALREMYHSQSSLVHPNLESMSARTDGPETEELSERVVKYPIFGGLLSSDMGRLTVYAVIQSTLFALNIIKVIFVEPSGNWDTEYGRIKEKVDSFIAKAKASNS